MEVTVEEGGESGCTSIEEDIGCAWNSWAPVVDWGPFSVNDEFHGFIESMVCDEIDDDDGTVAKVSATSHEPSPCHSIPSSTTTSAGKTPPAEEDDDKGLPLVHLLMAAAEAMTGPNKSPDLARVILVRLKELAPAAAAAGRSNMERLAVHFTDALQGLLNGSDGGGGGVRHSAAHRDYQHHPVDALAAYQLLQDMAPYVKFGHFTANQAILEAVAGERRVHIVDYDIMEGVQWASLMQALVSAKDGTPPPHVRITAVTRSGGGGGGRRGMGMVQETGRRLVAFAASIGQPFSFGQCRLDPDQRFRPAGMKVVRGEAVVVNCVLHAPHLPHRPARSVASFLSGAAALGARVVTVVEEEEEAGEDGGFVGRFMDELHRYSAMWDSLEAGYPMQGNARGLVERLIMGPRIVGAVGRAYRRREGAEGEGRWGEWMAGLGFGRVAISSFNHCQARLLLGLFNEGYRVEEAAPNKLALGWKSRRLLSTSVWSVPPPSPRSSPGDLIPSREDCDYFS